MQRVVLLVIDLFLIVVATIIALFLRDNLEISTERLALLAPYVVATIVAAVPVLLLFGLNRTVWRFSALPDYMRITLAVIVTVLSAVALGFVFNRMEGVARSLPVLQGLMMLCLLVSVRVFMRLRHAQRDSGQRTVPVDSQKQELVLVVGINTVTELFLQSVHEFADETIKIAGLLGRGDRHRGRLVRLHPVLGTADELEKVLADLEVHGQLIDRIVITSRFEQLSRMVRDALLRVERASNIQVDFFADRVVLSRDPLPARDLPGPEAKLAAGTTELDVDAFTARPYFRWKRVLDLVVATVAIVCLAPVAVLVGLVIVCVAGPPPIFWQQRPGANRRPFKLYKFRTMRGAHDRYGRRIADAERLSMIGRFVRRVRLDELPQLYNILVGEMSFVGPRPLLPADQSHEFAARLAVRPGLTGWAQIKGGRELTASDKAVLDIWYVKHASFWLDVKIILGTLWLIVVGERTDHEAIRLAWQEVGDNNRLKQKQLARYERVGEEMSALQKSRTSEGYPAVP